jgi:electron transport complex protein RnfE
MAQKKSLLKEFTKGFISDNPIFVIVLGLCPTLAVSTSVENAIGMGIAATFVLVSSNVIISSVRKLIPDRIRIPCFIVIIAAFVTIVELVMSAYAPQLAERLGIFVPLIVVNCIIMGRAEAFASRRGVVASLLDGLGMGLGFCMALVLVACIREGLGAGTILGHTLVRGYEPAITMVLAPGALLVMGLLIGLIRWIRSSM